MSMLPPECCAGAWEQYGSSRKCADCGSWLPPATPATPKPEEEELRRLSVGERNAVADSNAIIRRALQTIEQQRAEIERLTADLTNHKEYVRLLREDVESTLNALEPALPDWPGAQDASVDEMAWRTAKEVASLREANARLERERDEIGALAANGMDKIRTVERERDEARGLLRDERGNHFKSMDDRLCNCGRRYPCEVAVKLNAYFRIDAALKEGE
jgi:hypothetical protein